MKSDFKRIYLDLDRTLFDTARFMPQLFAAAEKLYGVAATQLQDNMEQFFYHVDGMKTYNFFDHISEYGVGELQARNDINRALASEDFLFPDARLLLTFLATQHFDLHVLSFGKTNYQTFKYKMIQELHRIPLTVVFEAKNKFLIKQSAEPSLLVDDKLVESLPEWCSAALIDRSAKSPIKQESPQLFRVNTLAVIYNLLYNDFNQKGNLT